MKGFLWVWGCATVLTVDINMRSCLNGFCKDPEAFQLVSDYYPELFSRLWPALCRSPLTAWWIFYVLLLGFGQTTLSDPSVGGDLFHFETTMTTSCYLFIPSRLWNQCSNIHFDLETASQGCLDLLHAINEKPSKSARTAWRHSGQEKFPCWKKPWADPDWQRASGGDGLL